MLEKRVADAPDPESFLTGVNAALQAETRLDADKLWIELDPDRGVLSINGQVEDIASKRIAVSRPFDPRRLPTGGGGILRRAMKCAHPDVPTG